MTRMKLLLQIAAVLFILCMAVGAVSATNTVKDTWVTSTGTTYAGNTPSLSVFSVSTIDVYNKSVAAADLVYFDVSTIKATPESSTQDNLTYKFTLPTIGSAGSNVSVNTSGTGTKITTPQFTINFGDESATVSPYLGKDNETHTYEDADHYVPAVTIASAWNPSTSARFTSKVSVDPAFIDVNKTTISFENGTGVQFTETFTYLGPVGSVSNSSKIGYTFQGWNLSETMLFNDTGIPQNATGYINETGIWVNKTVTELTVYANWTPITYTVTFDANGGQGSMADMSFTYDVAQNLNANTFQRYNSNFVGWLCNGTRYDDKALVNNLTTEDGGSVTMVAQWETYSTGGSSSGTSYLGSSEVSVISPQQPTVAPTAKPTEQPATPTEQPATPTVSPVTQPTTESTQKSPAPFVGLIAGLGAAAVLVLRRK